MNKKIISAAVLVGLAGSASAVNVNPDGIGSVLLYPYYTTNGGKFTNIQIVNTTNETKAVKVRLNEAVNTWEVLDFNVYMSPYDVWTAAIVDDNGTPVIQTTDTTCTVPKLTKEALRPDMVNAFAKSHKDPGNIDVSKRIREGHIEAFEMGVVTDADIITAVDHGTTGKPANCARVQSAWNGKPWTRTTPNAAGTISAPTGGLFGSADIVNVANGTAASYDATAIQNYYNRPSHAYPGSPFPNIAGRLDVTGSVTAAASQTANVVYQNQALSINFDDPAKAISAVLMASSIYNHFVIDDSLNAATDWVVTFPTKHAHVNAPSYSQTLRSGQYGLLPKGQNAVDNGGTAPFADGYNVPMSITTYDREEQTAIPQVDFSPSIVGTADISYETNVIEFDDKRNVLASNVSNKVNAAYSAGWAVFEFGTDNVLTAPATLNGGVEYHFAGRPVLGFSTYELQNTNANGKGILANYAGLNQHKYKRVITSR